MSTGSYTNGRIIPATPDDIFASSAKISSLQLEGDKAGSMDSQQISDDNRYHFKDASDTSRACSSEHSLFIRALMHRLTSVRHHVTLWHSQGASDALNQLLHDEDLPVTADVLRRACAATKRGRPQRSSVGGTSSSNSIQEPPTAPGGFPIWPFRTYYAGCGRISDIQNEENYNLMYEEDANAFMEQSVLDRSTVTILQAEDKIDLDMFSSCLDWLQYLVRLLVDLLSSEYEDYIQIGLTVIEIILPSINRIGQQLQTYVASDISTGQKILQYVQNSGKNPENEQAQCLVSICRNIWQARVAWSYLDDLDEPLQQCYTYGGKIAKKVEKRLSELVAARSLVEPYFHES